MRLSGDFACEKINDPGLIIGTKEYYFVQKALDSNLNNNINELYELRNLMNTWSQQEQQELHESFVNRLRM